MPDKALIWLGSSLKDPAELSRTRAAAGRTVGAEVREIRIRIAGAHRVFYVTTRPEAIYVLHAFEKKTQKTSAADLRMGRERFRSLEQLRQRDDREGRP